MIDKLYLLCYNILVKDNSLKGDFYDAFQKQA